ncbi:hypothetical protein DY468_13470 [Rhodopseudomonas sp. BR0M22]|nr:hypothetical protein [Rhodopseudomonas sp. BR0M22]
MIFAQLADIPNDVLVAAVQIGNRACQRSEHDPRLPIGLGPEFNLDPTMLRQTFLQVRRQLIDRVLSNDLVHRLYSGTKVYHTLT